MRPSAPSAISWSTRSGISAPIVRPIAAETSISPTSVHRYFKLLGLKPHRTQALERTQPMLPMGLGYVEGVTQDYVRHGTSTLFCRAQHARSV